jgi:Zn finger protein HypA/HybF involved in hydrogenase expression
MHEYALMQEIINSILERLKEEQSPIPVKEVILKLGILDIHSEAAARQAFEILTKDTPLQDSQLTLEVKPVMMQCTKCGLLAPYQVEEHTHANELLPVVVCPVCDGLAQLSGGQGVESIELIFEEEGFPG